MDVAGTLYSNILLLGAAHGAFLAIALSLVRTGSRVALRLLSLLTAVFAIDLGINYLNGTGALVHFPRLIFVETTAAFLYGPLLYFYVAALTAREPWRFSAGRWLHFLPFVASIALIVPFLRLPDAVLVDMIYADADVDEHLGNLVVGKWLLAALPRLLLGTYLVLGFRRLIQHGRDIREQFSWIEKISLNWLRNLLIAIGVLWLLYLIALAFGGRGPVENLLNVVIVVVVYALGYKGLRQPAIFTQRSREAQPGADVEGVAGEAVPATEKPKYQKSALDGESSKLLLQELQELMARERPYLNSKLTLSQLAEQLGLSSNYLSQIINQQTGSNFFDYINGHRVEAAKKTLVDPTQARKSVLTIAMDSGFNSKSAFYTAFKHHTSMTPNQFRQANVS